VYFICVYLCVFVNVHIVITVRLSRVSITGYQILSGEIGVIISRLVLIMCCVCVYEGVCACVCTHMCVLVCVCVCKCAYCYNCQALEGIDHWRSDIVR